MHTPSELSKLVAFQRMLTTLLNSLLRMMLALSWNYILPHENGMIVLERREEMAGKEKVTR